MATVWITYSWADNKNSDVDYIAQELVSVGLKVKLDRWNIQVGIRLWDQIEEFIQNPNQCDAWLLVATQASLGSEPCREEYAYALDRALNSRGNTFPVIALFSATVDKSLIPAGIKTRLFVSLRDPDWKERILSAAENRQPNINRPQVMPYFINLHYNVYNSSKLAVEVRPRAGTWAPFVAAVPLSEKSKVSINLYYGPPGRPPNTVAMFGPGEGTNTEWAFWYAQNEASPTMSYYIVCEKLPTKLLFGADSGPQYSIDGHLLSAMKK